MNNLWGDFHTIAKQFWGISKIWIIYKQIKVQLLDIQS